MRWFFIICVLLNALHCSLDAHADEIAELRARAEQGCGDEKGWVWFACKTAEWGDASDQWMLGHMYMNGKGVVQNYVQAHKWYNLAAVDSTGQTHERAARNRSLVEKMMTPQQVAEAQRLAGEWQVRQP